MIDKQVTNELLDKENVRLVGRSPEEDNDDIIVFVTQKKSLAGLSSDDIIPQKLNVEGKVRSTDVCESGEIKFQVRKNKYRPAPAGVSGGHYKITTGTLPATPPLLTEDEKVVTLTNEHVAAPPEKVEKRDEIYQPGPHDGGTDNDVIGHVLEWGGIEKNEDNKTDSALVEHDESVLRENEILGLGDLTGFDESVDVDDGPFMKSGRTTEVTEGEIMSTDATVRVRGYYDEPVTFVGVDVFSPMSRGGDSGSLICHRSGRKLLGSHLLFAGSPQSTIAVPIQNVFEEHGNLAVKEPKENEGGEENGSLFSQIIRILLRLFT